MGGPLHKTYFFLLYRTLTLFTAKSAKGAKFLMLFFAFLASFAVQFCHLYGSE